MQLSKEGLLLIMYYQRLTTPVINFVLHTFPVLLIAYTFYSNRCTHDNQEVLNHNYVEQNFMESHGLYSGVFRSYLT